MKLAIGNRVDLLPFKQNPLLWRNEMSKYDEYKACQLRGHGESNLIVTQGNITKHRCRFCGVSHWIEKVLHEENVPEPVSTGQTQ